MRATKQSKAKQNKTKHFYCCRCTKVNIPAKCTAALRTRVGALVSVLAHVPGQLIRANKCPVTPVVCAHIRALTGMGPQVCAQMGCLEISFPTPGDFADKWARSTVSSIHVVHGSTVVFILNPFGIIGGGSGGGGSGGGAATDTAALARRACGTSGGGV